MLFYSYIFILLFLPVTIIGYYSLNYLKKYKPAQVFLILMSFIFYGYLHPQSLMLLAGSIVFNYLLYLLFQRKLPRYEDKAGIRKAAVAIGIMANLVILFYYKYYDFFIDNINMVLGKNYSIRNVVVPLGISFITFRQIAFIVDAYRDEVADCNIAEYGLFASFFPHISSGPIITHEQFLPLLKEESRKNINWDNFAQGVYLFGMGLGKKVLIADWFGGAVNWGYAHIGELNSTSALFVSIAYSIQIYFDFSGYSDMAVGLSRMLNLDLPINFNSPYKADTISEFWARWHISLTRFLRKYLYIPLGGNRKGQLRTWLNTLIVFIISGLWHGPSWNFICWGALHGIFLILSKRYKRLLDKLPRIINRIITLMFVNAAWILFRAGSFDEVKEMFRALGSNQWGALNIELSSFFHNSFLRSFPGGFLPDNTEAYLAVAIVGMMIFLGKNITEKAQQLKYNKLTILWTAGVMVISILSFSGISSFIYANF